MKENNRESGAALVMVLLITLLLSIACIGLLVGASMNTANVTDAVAEQQAYYAAESGIQSAINVLRRNTTPSVLLEPSLPASHTDNKIDYSRAVKINTSNLPDDPSSIARLSRWINYNYTPNGATVPDRVTLGTGTYDPKTGSAFSVTIQDPDNPYKILSLTTSASIGGGGNSKAFGIPLLAGATIKYTPNSPGATANVDVSTSQIGVGLGNFTISADGVGTTISDTPFEITVKMTAPLIVTIKLRGTIKGGTITKTSVGNVRIVFDAPVFSLLGSAIGLPISNIIPNAPNVNGGVTNLNVTVELTQPRRLLIRSTGYGPRGAKKVMEAIVRRDNFDGLIPTTVALVGPLSGSIFKSSNNILQQVVYSGNDILSAAKIPPIGVLDTSSGTTGGLLSNLLTTLTGPLCQGCQIIGTPVEVSDDEAPDFLKSPTALNDTINGLKDMAKDAGRYFASGETPPNFGGSDGNGITFIDGDAKLSGAGGGILIVTGKLVLDGAANFNGTIFVTGEQGVSRTGSGNVGINGNLVVAPYKTGNLLAGFLPPKYDLTGGLVSNILYNTSNLLFGSDNYNVVVVGVVEK